MSIITLAGNVGIRLSQDQQDHASAIEWFLSEEPTSEGRTYLLALGFIDKALDSPGDPIFFFDHAKGSSEDGRVLMAKTIRRIVGDFTGVYAELADFFYVTNEFIKFRNGDEE